MFFKRNKKNISYDKDVSLRAYIAQGIKALYFDRKVLYSVYNKEYTKISETLAFLEEKIRGLEKEKARMMIPEKNGFYYRELDQELTDSIINYLNFIAKLPPPSYKFISKWKKSAEIGMMKVPTLSFILYSLLDYRLPAYAKDMVNDYTNVAAAIVDIMKNSSFDQKAIRAGESISMKLNRVSDKDKKKQYEKNIVEWIKLGLIV